MRGERHGRVASLDNSELAMNVSTDISQLDSHQMAQEEEYSLPYHWFWTPESEMGRAYFAYLSRVVALIPKDTQTLLDVGCGDGRATAYLHDKLPNTKIKAIDYSKRALELARILSTPREIRWEQSDLRTHESSETGVFDVVTAIEVVEHIPPEKLVEALRGMRAELRAGGRIIITTPSVQMPRPEKHFQHFTPSMLRQAFGEAGCEVVLVEGQEVANHIFFSIYKLFDNRWWSVKPVVRWLNKQVYPKWVSASDPEKARRLIVVAQPKLDV